MKMFYIMVGLSGSGKSYYANKIKEQITMFDPNEIVDIISSDAIRGELFGDESDQSDNAKVFDEVRKRIRTGLLKYHNVIVDATSINVKSRNTLIGCMKCLTPEKRANYKCCAVVMTTPLNICKKQNLERDRVVPEFVIDRQIKQFEIPFYEEGFDDITLVVEDLSKHIYEPTTDEKLEIFQRLMAGFDQKTHHHAYTLDVHCAKVAEEIAKRTDDKVLYRAGLIHDIGKLYTGEPKEDGSGDYRYYSHHNVGAYKLLQNLDYICFENYKDTLDLLFYINFHMLPFFLESEKAKNKWRNLFGEKKFNNLLIFNECDKIGCGTKRD